MNSPLELSRRRFLVASGSAALSAGLPFSTMAKPVAVPTIAVFSKVYQGLKLNFEDAAALTEEAGLDGVDCPLRPGGEILPERASDDLRKYDEALRKRNRRVLLLTTGITDVASPHAEDILRTAKKIGVEFYRLGFVDRTTDESAEKQVRETKAKLKDL